MHGSPLPIVYALPALRDALAASSNVVLEAPPGAGKTTVVPTALLDAPWLGGQRILLLEPRRLAARAAARRMASQRGEPVGATVGVRVRGESVVSARTRVEVLTEGILTRQLVADPALEGVGLVIFDEFHERSIHADAGLALALETQAVLRPELRLLVMSATLEGERVATLLGGAPVVRSEGRLFPVATHYRARHPDRRLEADMASAVRAALADHEGDLLAFLPGAGEIRRTADLLADLPPGIDVLPLYGDLAPEAQDRAIAPGAPGRRKVVLATGIAESSLTIEGVRIVVDGGLARVPRYSPRTGMTRLETVRVSRASADQRRGRAGRTAPGTCIRLWPEGEHGALLGHAPPEILEADLAPLALDLASAGVHDPTELRWLDVPPAGALARARALLTDLDAIDAAGHLTPHGRALHALGTHPRLGHLVLRAREIGEGNLGAALAALLEERDILRTNPDTPDVDVRHRVGLILGRAGRPSHAVHEGALQRVREQQRRWRKAGDGATSDVERTGLLLAFAYPDRIARRRGAGPRYLLANGTGATLAAGDPLVREEWLVVAETDGKAPEARIYLAAPVELAALRTHLPHRIETRETVRWDDAAREVVAERRELLGAIPLKQVALEVPDGDATAALLLDVIRREGLAALEWTEAATRLRERLAFAHALDAAWPDMQDTALAAALEPWLGAALRGARRLHGRHAPDLHAGLLTLLDWRQREQLDRLAPTHLDVPSGSRLPIDYADPAAPVLRVRMQELFGQGVHPTVGGGRVPLVLHLLSPAHRPMQVTRDLPGFWRGSYAEVRKEMKGRYPRHPWPDDPLEAEATRRAKPRGT